MLCEQAKTYFEVDDEGIRATKNAPVNPSNLSKEEKMTAIRTMLRSFLKDGRYVHLSVHHISKLAP